MSEAPNEAPKDEAPLLSNLDFLERLGWSVNRRQGYIRSRSPSRMQVFEGKSRNSKDIDDKVLEAAYYALELSTNLPEYTKSVEAIDGLEEPGSKVNEKIVDNFIIVTTVHKLLAGALRQSREFKPVVSSQRSPRTGSDTQSHLRLVPDLPPELKTGRLLCLTAIDVMSKRNDKLGWISAGTAREAKATLEILIKDSEKLS